MKSQHCDIWKKRISQFVILLSVLLALIMGGCSSFRDIPQTGCYKREDMDPRIEAVIDEFGSSVTEIMKNTKVVGASIALVDTEGIIWTEGFGYTDRKRRKPVTPDTPFLINCMGKTFTATTAMIAVQDGLLDLDEPITTYLPDFKLYSRYEENPEKKITLTHLLSQTSGLPVEATIGNMFESSAEVSFEEHIRSLHGTWLVGPVGHFVYGHTNLDLAAYIIQAASGEPFEQYMTERLFKPLGMSNTALGPEAELKLKDRAMGHERGFTKPRKANILLGNSGVCTSARDLARFVQLHLNRGKVNGKTIISESLLSFDVMYKPRTGDIGKELYCFGVFLSNTAVYHAVVLYHRGTGGGFNSMMWWYPEYGFGMVLLMNQDSMTIPAGTICDRLFAEKLVVKKQTIPFPSCEGLPGAWKADPNHNPSTYMPEWKKYCGSYDFRFSGVKLKWWARLGLILRYDKYTPRITVYEKNGYFCVTESRFFKLFWYLWDRAVEEKLQQIRPGLFFSKSGRILDLRGEIPTWCNYRLKKR
jgi:CubicO group peptidase (beta-lactamase class C family)